MEETTVKMTQQELEQFRAYQEDLKKKESAEKSRQMREDYRQMVDDEIEASIGELRSISEGIKSVKSAVLENFKSIIAMKQEMFNMSGKAMPKQSHTFTNSEGNKRITLGVYVTDNYMDTADEGIALISEYIESLATDENSKALVSMVMRLLAKDKNGVLKASRIIQLRQIAKDIGSEKFMKGVEIIEEAYKPAVSKTFVKAEYKDENGAWTAIPLGMTEA
ncbi:MAG: DUF3164 family protein [Candidatus Egerieousia sp.]